MTDLTTPTLRADRKLFEQAVDELEQSRLDVYRAGLPIGKMDPKKRRRELEAAIVTHADARQALLDLYENPDDETLLGQWRSRAHAAEAELAALQKDRERLEVEADVRSCAWHHTETRGAYIDVPDSWIGKRAFARLADTRQTGRTEEEG